MVLEYFEHVTKTVRSMVDTSIDRYRATVGATVVRPRYPAPHQASLLAGDPDITSHIGHLGIPDAPFPNAK